MKTPNLQQTKNYSLFKIDPTNRSVERTKKLRKSMEKWGFMPAYPLHCVKSGNHYIVKDGQHRLAVASALGLAVFFVVMDGCTASIPELNIAKPWSSLDYVSSFASGNTNYQQLLDFKIGTGLPLTVCVSLLAGESAGSGNQQDALKGGLYRVKPGALPLANTVARLVESAAAHIKWSRNTLFVDALSKCCRVPEFDPDTFITRMAANPALLQLQPTRETFLRMIESVYNFKSRTHIPLAFMANQVARSRNAVLVSVAKKKAKADQA